MKMTFQEPLKYFEKGHSRATSTFWVIYECFRVDKDISRYGAIFTRVFFLETTHTTIILEKKKQFKQLTILKIILFYKCRYSAFLLVSASNTALDDDASAGQTLSRKTYFSSRTCRESFKQH